MTELLRGSKSNEVKNEVEERKIEVLARIKLRGIINKIQTNLIFLKLP